MPLFFYHIVQLLFLSKADVLFYIIYSKVINKTDSEKEGRNTYMTETQNIILIHIDLLY